MQTIDLATAGGATLALLPEVVLTGAALVVLLVLSWRHTTAEDSRLAGYLSLGGVGLSAVALAYLWTADLQPLGLAHMIAVDTFRYAAVAIILIATAATILLSLQYVERERLLAPEYYCLILLAATGMMYLAGATDLIVSFLGLEVMSVAVYVLVGFNRGSVFSAEAALKYFLIGAFASAFLLYGIALIYGATGTTNIMEIGARLGQGNIPVLGALGLGLLLIGFGFKVAAVPFHMWAPDVYDGAPTPITGFMATGVKAAGVIALTRILFDGFSHSIDLWQPVVAALAIASMVLGNLVALSQRSLKRMLAYSSIAHAGYLLTAIWTGSSLGAGATLLYILAYVLTTLATFGILAALGRGGERDVTLDTIAGLGARRPWLAFALSACMLSLLGFPGTLGFIGKWTILMAIVNQAHAALGIILVLTSLVSAGYYLPVIMSMYMKPASATSPEGKMSGAGIAVIVVTVGLLLVFGFWPGPVLGIATNSARVLSGAVPSVNALVR